MRNHDWLVTREGLEVVTDPEALERPGRRARRLLVDQVARRERRGLAVVVRERADRIGVPGGRVVLDELERLTDEPVVGRRVPRRGRDLETRRRSRPCSVRAVSITDARSSFGRALERLHEQRAGRPAVGDDAVGRRRPSARTSRPAPCTASSPGCSRSSGSAGSSNGVTLSTPLAAGPASSKQHLRDARARHVDDRVPAGLLRGRERGRAREQRRAEQERVGVRGREAVHLGVHVGAGAVVLLGLDDLEVRALHQLRRACRRTTGRSRRWRAAPRSSRWASSASGSRRTSSPRAGTEPAREPINHGYWWLPHCVAPLAANRSGTHCGLTMLRIARLFLVPTTLNSANTLSSLSSDCTLVTVCVATYCVVLGDQLDLVLLAGDRDAAVGVRVVDVRLLAVEDRGERRRTSPTAARLVPIVIVSPLTPVVSLSAGHDDVSMTRCAGRRRSRWLPTRLLVAGFAVERLPPHAAPTRATAATSAIARPRRAPLARAARRRSIMMTSSRS